MTEYNELRDGQEFYGNGYKQGYADAELKYNKGEKIMTDKIKQAVADEFKYRASRGRWIFTMEEVIYIVNEVIDEVAFEKTGAVSPEQPHKVAFEKNGVMSQEQYRKVAMQIQVINGELRYLAEKVNEVSSILEELKIKGNTENAERPQGEWGDWIRLDLAKRVIAKFEGYLDEDMIKRIQIALEKENEAEIKGGTE